MDNNKRVAINIIANIIAFGVNFAISFFLTPYIVQTVGKEVYGFVSLGNNFVNYASLATIAINSMGSRFITLKLQEKDNVMASKYFSSILFSNILLYLILVIPLALIVIFMNQLFNLPNQNVVDIKILWSLLFLNLGIDLVSNVFAVSTFASNRIDLSAKRNIEAYILKAIIIVLSFKFFTPYVSYIGFATIIYSLYNLFSNIRYTKKLLPNIKISKNLFDKSCVKELSISGIWNTISRVGSIALTELDLLLSNTLIDASAMGILSLAKTIPNQVTSLTSTIVNAFMPNLTIVYANAKNDKQYLLKKIRDSIKILIVFHSVIYGVLIAYSDIFYKLWLKTESEDIIQYIYILGIISVAGCFISAVSNVMFNIFTIFNKLKVSSITVVITGLVSSILTFIIVKNTTLGLIAIAGISVLLVSIRNIGIIMPYAAKCIGVPWYTFYSDMALNIIILAFSIFISFMLKKIISIDNWIGLILICIIDAIIIFVINFFMLLKKEERNYIINKILRRKEQ